MFNEGKTVGILAKVHNASHLIVFGYIFSFVSHVTVASDKEYTILRTNLIGTCVVQPRNTRHKNGVFEMPCLPEKHSLTVEQYH